MFQNHFDKHSWPTQNCRALLAIHVDHHLRAVCFLQQVASRTYLGLSSSVAVVVCLVVVVVVVWWRRLLFGGGGGGGGCGGGCGGCGGCG